LPTVLEVSFDAFVDFQEEKKEEPALHVISNPIPQAASSGGGLFSTLSLLNGR
jgi:hypothetical protein